MTPTIWSDKFRQRLNGHSPGDAAQVMGLVDAVLATAREASASDVHLVPQESSLAMQFRLDGVLQPVAYMQVSGTPEGYCSALQRELIAALHAAGHATPAQCLAMDRFAFYERVKQAFAIVHTGELQPYANVIFKKGVIAEALRA